MSQSPAPERLAVAGTGTIACGVASVAAAAGLDVTLLGRSPESAERGVEAVRQALEKLDSDATVAATTDASELDRTTYVIEAIAEELGLKAALMRGLHDALDGQAVLATTTSSLSVDALARESGRPDRFAAFHVFNPVHRMDLVEVAFPPQATDETKRRTLALCTALGKRPVQVPDLPGFVVNRLLFPYLFDAVRLHESSGMSPEEIDTCMTLGAGHPMGPLALLDFVGLDVAVAIGQSIGAYVPGSVRRLIGEGALGRKTGRGFYDYSQAV